LTNERALYQSNANRFIYIRKRKAQLGEIKDEKNRKVKRKNKGTVVLLYLTSTLNLSDLGSPTRDINIPVSIAIRVNKVRNPITTKR